MALLGTPELLRHGVASFHGANQLEHEPQWLNLDEIEPQSEAEPIDTYDSEMSCIGGCGGRHYMYALGQSFLHYL